MMKKWDVLGMGIVTVDDLIYLDHYPAPDSKEPVRASQRQGGGLTGTAVVAAARLGARTAYYGILGEDELSSFSLREFASEGVDCSTVVRRKDANPRHSIIMIDQSNGQRTILYSTEISSIPQPEEIPLSLISDCKVLVTDYVAGVSGVFAARQARSLGIPVVADIENISSPDVKELMVLTNHLIMGFDLAHELTGEEQPANMVHAMARKNRDVTVVTAGAQGCWYCLQMDTVYHVPALKVKVVDTTGCGDVFHGAYAASIARGEDIHRAIRVATVTAGIKASCPGGRSGIPDRTKVEGVLKEMLI
jgi:sulfofructose kinase